jgi:ribonuclease D
VSNWALRPLSPEQFTYAALDAACVVDIYRAIESQFGKQVIQSAIRDH